MRSLAKFSKVLTKKRDNEEKKKPEKQRKIFEINYLFNNKGQLTKL